MKSGYYGVDKQGVRCRGHHLVCRFGYTFLCCKPEHIPDDPLLGSPRLDLATNDVIAEQFLCALHQWKNDPDIITKLLNYLCDDGYSQGLISQNQSITVIASAMASKKLLVFAV